MELYKSRLKKKEDVLEDLIYVVEEDGKKVSDERNTNLPKNRINKTLDSGVKVVEDIAPTKKIGGSTVHGTTDDDKRTWFNSGLFEDGYDFGDISKTILGTFKDVKQDVSRGALKIGEGLVDTIAYGVGGVADLLGNEKFAQDTKKFIARDLITESKLDNFFANLDPMNMPTQMVKQGFEAVKTKDISKLVNLDDTFEQSSILGDKSDSLVQSAGQLVGTVGLQTVGVPWWLTTGVAGFGGEVQESFNQDATYGEAGISGLVSAGAEILTEKLSGGISFGGKTLDAGLKSALTKKISNKTLQTLAKFGIDAVGEGTEEVVSEVLSNVGKKLSYEDDKTWEELLLSEQAMDAYLESFIGGAVLGGGFNVGNVANSIRTGRDYETGLSSNEQKVVDSIVNERTTELKKQKALELETEKAILAKETEQKGILSTTEKNALREQIKAQIESGQIDVSSIKLKGKDTAAIQKEIEENLKKGLIDTDTIESILGDSGLDTDTYLLKSYQEKAMRSEQFTYDEEITDEKVKAVYDSASKYFNNTTRSHEFVEKVAKIAKERGTNYGFINNEELSSLGHDIEGKQVNGLVRTTKDGTQTVLINIDSPKALNTIVGHETTHLLEGTQEYQDLQEAIFNYAIEKGDFNDRQSSLSKLYEGIDNANVDAELTADLVGDYLFTDSKFIESLSTEKPTVFQKIKELIDDLVVKFKGTKEEKALREVQKKFREAYKQNVTQKETDIKYSVDDKKPNYMWHSSSKANIDLIKQYGFRYDKESSYFATDFDISKGYGEDMIMLDQNEFNIKDVTQELEGNDNRKLARDNAIAEGYDGIRYQTSKNNYDVEITNIDKLNEVVKKTEEENQRLIKALMGEDTQYSLTDNQGRTLTKEQQEYFKDSKVRDDEGRLLEVYHGSPNANINIFDIRNSGRNTMSGEYGLFFTNNEKFAEDFSYERIETDSMFFDKKGAKGKIYNVYLNIKNPLDFSKLTSKEIENLYDYASDLGQIDGKEKFIENMLAWQKIGNHQLMKVNLDLKSIANNTEYDGIIVKTDVIGTDLEYIVFNSNQIKNVDNLNPTTNDDIRYSLTPEYGMSHRPSTDYGDASNFETNMPDVFEHPEWYMFGGDSWYKKAYNESWNALKKVRNNPDGEITIYRATIGDTFNEGDWVSPSRTYAEWHNYSNLEDKGKVIELKVKAKDIRFAGDDLNEFGYFPNGVDEYSLSNFNEQRAAVKGNYNVYGEDVKYQEIAPLQEEIQTLSERLDTPLNASKPEIAPVSEDNYQATTEADLPMLEQQYAEDFRNIDETSMPSEIEPNIPDDVSYEPTSPFDNKDINEVGNRSIKAYQYENPEVKPYFQQEARTMLGDLDNSIKGERLYNDQLYYETNGEQGYFGQKRQTTDDIAYLLDNFNYTYDQIRKGLNAIIEDNGAENNAVSKRIEFLLDERLRNGYTDAMGYQIPANQEYINFIEEKQITEYLSSIPFPSDGDVSNSNNIAPVREQYEAIRPEKTNEPRMIRVKEPQQLGTVEGRVTEPTIPEPINRAYQLTIDGKAERIISNPTYNEIAQVLVDEPKTDKQRNQRKWAIFKANVLDKGAVFEDLSLRENNRELMGKWDYTLTSEARGQTAIGKGHFELDPYTRTEIQTSKSLNDIRAEVESKSLTKDFYDYMYHKHNIDRMTLSERFNAENKAVFGDNVTADISRAKVAEYENTYPEFIEYAQDVYDYLEADKQVLVDSGVISQETADLWKQMYPHYVPIRRVTDTGFDINVPLDTRRTGINSPVKKAVGGSQDILPLFDTMASRTLQTYRAAAKNSFGVELMNTLGTKLESAETSVDEVIDSVDMQETLLQEGKNGRNPTFTVFENGEKSTFEISKDMYDALMPLSESSLLSKTFLPLNKVGNFHRGVLTEYNPVFMLTNAIKDAQDILINSQHPLKTYAKLGEAYNQLIQKGYWYQEYMANGGEQNSYFDSFDNTFKTERNGLGKVLDVAPLKAISQLNNFIEMSPRLAEYIASREAGQSIEVSMLDASRVTTNFKAGGNLTKFLNRNGATFLNASVQGAMQQVRNVREAKANGARGWANLATKFAVAGLPAVLLNALLWDDDEEYEELSDYVKQNYYIVAKTDDGTFIRIPKGRTLAVIQDTFEQMKNLITGDDEVDLKAYINLMLNNLAPNNPVDNNVLSPIVAVTKNQAWHGGEIVPTRLQDLPAAEQYDESIDSFSKWIGEVLNVSPYKVNYLLDQYTGGIGDVFLPMMTPEAESGSDSVIGDLIAPLKDKFVVDSTFNNQNVSDFYDTKEELAIKANGSKATDEDILRNKYFNSINGNLSELYKEKREIQNSDLPNKEKYEQAKEIQEEINALTEEALSQFNNIKIAGDYAVAGDIEYYKKTDSEGKESWTKVNGDEGEDLDSLNLTRAERNIYFNAKDEISSIVREYTNSKKDLEDLDEDSDEYKEATEQLSNDKKKAIVDKIKSTGLTDNQKAYLYKKYYNSDTIDTIVASEINVDAYLDYSTEEFEADKDNQGKSISGSRKAKVINYVNSMDLSIPQKAILIKATNTFKFNEYNNQIVEYVGGLDISYEEKVSILEELDMTVDSEGNVRWK